MTMVSYTRTFRLSGGTREELDAHTDEVMDAISDLEDDILLDSSVAVDLNERIMEITVTVGGIDDYDAAVTKADSSIRAAIHACGGNTSTWHDTLNTLETRSEMIQPA